MSDQRTKDTIQRLAHKRPGVVKLAEAVDPAPILTKTGLGSVARQSTSAGIASPLTETAYEDRAFYATSTVTSSDGLFTFRVRRLETLLMDDAGGNRVQFNFQEPAT